ncbi:hypothetical protein Tco_0581082 [Tanacetum coccineum]
MMLFARAITQRYFTPTNNRLRTSSNTRNQAIVQANHVDIQSENVGNSGRFVRRTTSNKVDVTRNADKCKIHIYVRIRQISQENRQKTGKHELEKRKNTREAKDSKPKLEKVKSQSKKVKP